MGVILGIDIGGSSTKIVGLAPDLSVIDMLRVKADDPLTSLYGAMGNFLSTHHLQLSDIRHIALTGVGSSYVEGGVDPKIMGVGPVPASRQAMQKAGLTIDDIDLVEANEAFAAQSIAVARELHFDMSKVNVNGGAISIGHPVGASGARIIVTLLHEMLKRDDAKKGLATLCIGGGQGVATIFEKC